MNKVPDFGLVERARALEPLLAPRPTRSSGAGVSPNLWFPP